MMMTYKCRTTKLLQFIYSFPDDITTTCIIMTIMSKVLLCVVHLSLLLFAKLKVFLRNS